MFCHCCIVFGLKLWKIYMDLVEIGLVLHIFLLSSICRGTKTGGNTPI